MRALMRGLAVVAVAAAALWAVPSAASAVTSPPDPCQTAEGYAAPANCKVLIEDVQATCTDDLSGANLAYSLTVAGGLAADKVTVTFADSAGKTASVSGQPLSGKVAWPASIKTTNATVTFTTETATPYTVSRTLTTPACISQVLADDGGNTVSAVLASTGAQVGPLAAIAGGLLVVGLTTIIAARRRRHATH